MDEKKCINVTDEFSNDILFKLIEVNKDNTERLDTILECVQAFEDYHSAIFEMEMKMKIYGNSSGADYRDMVSELDSNRTNNHNAMLVRVNILNRMAEQANLPLVYAGTVSEEKPFRREVADAVLAFVERVILQR